MKFVIGCALIVSAVSANAFDFKGISLGETVDHGYLAQAHGLSCASRKDGGLSCSSSTTIAGESAELSLRSDSNNKVVSMNLIIESKSFELVAIALQQKFGSPKITKSTVQNGFGAVFEQQQLRWSKKDGQELTIRKYSSDLKTSIVSFTTREERVRMIEPTLKKLNDL